MTTATRKTTCPISRETFRESAQPIVADVGGQKLVLSPKEFSTGSFGFFTNGKMVVTINGTPVTVQANLTLTVVGSKDTLA